MGINIADIVLAAMLLLAVLYGWRSGTINVIAKVGSLVLAYQMARSLSAKIAVHLADIIPPASDGGEAADKALHFLSLFIDTTGAVNRIVEIIIFIIIFILVNWLVRKLARMLTELFGKGVLAKINKGIGAFLALLFMLIIIVVLAEVILPACVGMGFGDSVLAFFRSSDILLPFIEDLAGLF